MEKIIDKRFLNRLDQYEQQRYLDQIHKKVPDVSDKFDTIEHVHESINLLERIRNRKKSAQRTSGSSGHSDED